MDKIFDTLIGAGPLGVVIAVCFYVIREQKNEIVRLHDQRIEEMEEHARIQSEEKNARIEDAKGNFAALSKHQTDYRDAIHKMADTAQVLARRDEDLDREARDILRSSVTSENRRLPPRRGGSDE